MSCCLLEILSTEQLTPAFQLRCTILRSLLDTWYHLYWVFVRICKQLARKGCGVGGGGDLLLASCCTIQETMLSPSAGSSFPTAFARLAAWDDSQPCRIEPPISARVTMLGGSASSRVLEPRGPPSTLCSSPTVQHGVTPSATSVGPPARQTAQ